MCLQRFFLKDQVLSQVDVPEFPLRLDPDDAKHARVMRLKPGEHIAVIDAASDYFECEAVSFDNELVVRIAKRGDAAGQDATVMLMQGLSKGDKMDEVVRHATELGIAAFVPLICERSVVKLDEKKTASRMTRWQSIAKSASMQSGRRFVPEIAAPMDIAAAADFLKEATCVLVCWEESMGGSIGEALGRALAASNTMPSDARVAVVVGPEGGFAAQEVACLLSCNPRAYAVSLGATSLRTETAGVVAPALALYELGGLQ